MDASTILDKIKDGSILKAIGLSKFMKQLAEGCKRLMEKVIELFHKAASKLSTLWRALSKAKDAMLSSLNEVVKSKSLCNDANEKMDKLKDMTTSLCNIEAIKLIKSLNGTKDRAVGDTMGAAREVDDGMEEATTKMKSAASTVGDAYHNLPSIITDGIVADTDDEIVNSLGVQIKDIDSDIQDLERATTAIEESDMLHAAKAIHSEIKELPAKVDVCQEMVRSCTEFADRSKSSIDSFLGKWSLETAISHIKEMSSLVSLSKLMETLAD